VSELIRSSSILPAKRLPLTIITADGLHLVGEVAYPLAPLGPLGPLGIGLLCLHPLPTEGGMMDSHLYKKASYRLPSLAGITVIRFNTRGATSLAGSSEGIFDNGVSEKLDVEAAINYAFDHCNISQLWVTGWSFGSDLAIRYARDSRVRGLILLSPPLRFSEQSDLEFWARDGRPVTALIPEFDLFLPPVQAREKFSVIPDMRLIVVAGAKHLWVGEPSVYRVLSEITQVISPESLPLPREVPIEMLG